MVKHFSKTKQNLISAIKKMEESVDLFVKRPHKDFSRKSRKISFFQTLAFVLSLQGRCLNKELLHFYSHSAETPSSSAMLQARSKIDLSAFDRLFHTFTDTCKKRTSFHGYLLLGADGSMFSLPQNKEESICWVKNPNTEQGRNVLTLNALYCLEDGLFEDVLFQKIHERDENKALADMVDRSDFSCKFIIVADRGYECYNTFAHIMEKGGYFVIRGKQGGSGILSALSLPEDEEFDQKVTVTICKRHTRKTKEDPQNFKRIRADAKFDFFTDGKEEYTMTFRVVKIKLEEGITETLFTNLPKEEFTSKELKHVYHLRWNIETAFLNLKYTLGAMVVHSKKAELVMQEIYTKIIAFNFCKELTNEVQVPQKAKWKYKYKLNMNVAMDICMEYWRSSQKTAPPDFERRLLKYLVPIRPNRNFPRATVQKAATPFQHRIA